MLKKKVLPQVPDQTSRIKHLAKTYEHKVSLQIDSIPHESEEHFILSLEQKDLLNAKNVYWYLSEVDPDYVAGTRLVSFAFSKYWHSSYRVQEWSFWQ